MLPHVAPAPDKSMVLGKATIRAAQELHLSNAALARVIGLSEPSISRIAGGARGIDPLSKEGQLALLVVLALQLVAALAAWTGSYHLIIGDGLLSARPWLNLALSAFSAFVFAMLLGGLWFGYWIRQEGLQLTHLVLSIWAVLAFFLFNHSWL